MAGRDFERELREAAQDLSGAATSFDDLQPVALLRRLGVTLPPTLHSADIDASLPPVVTLPGDAPTNVPDLGLSVWEAPQRIGFAPTLDVDEDGETIVPDDDSASVPPQAPPGERIGRYDVIGELGAGGMGRVVEGVDRDLGRRLAIKVVRDPARLTEARLARFVTEAQLTAQLEHPNIVPIHELGVTTDGRLYYAMKKVEGTSMAEVLHKRQEGDESTLRRWTRRRLLNAFVKVCLATGYAHRRGVVHRDLKPENIMLGEFGEVLLLDWGLARLVDHPDTHDPDASFQEPAAPTPVGKRPLTREGAATGTPGYISPEQARGERAAVGARSDVWSLGAVLYELLTGSTPFDGTNPFEYLRRVNRDAIEDPRDRAPDAHIGEELAGICMRCLAHDPGDRYRDGRELAQAVEDWLEGARRRREARARVREAGEHWATFRTVRDRMAGIGKRIRILEKQVKSWTPVADKSELLDLRAEREALALEKSSAFGAAVAAGERALAHDPNNAGARAFLARAWWARMLEAEARGDSADQAFYAQRVEQYDDGPLRALLRGDGAISLSTDPLNARVVAVRQVQKGLLIEDGERIELGATPLLQVPLSMGSWILTIEAPGRPPVTYPVDIPRGGHWDASAAPVPIPETVPEGFAYVPTGLAVLGADEAAISSLPPGRRRVPGFFISTLPVTMDDYLAFLNALHAEDPDAAWERVPRREAGLDGVAERYLPAPTDAGYRLPDTDADGDAWHGRYPVFAISAHDADAYCAWRTRITGRVHRLPTEEEWEKAARGVDGRPFPWGATPEATLCWIRDAQKGGPQPQVVGACRHDVSPYGVRDVAGGITEWTAAADDEDARRGVRGGSWASTLRQARLAGRFEEPSGRCRTYLGFRVVLDL